MNVVGAVFCFKIQSGMAKGVLWVWVGCLSTSLSDSMSRYLLAREKFCRGPSEAAENLSMEQWNMSL